MSQNLLISVLLSFLMAEPKDSTGKSQMATASSITALVGLLAYIGITTYRIRKTFSKQNILLNQPPNLLQYRMIY